MNNLNIFICAHKDFNYYPKNKDVYKIITDKGTLNNNYELDIIYEENNKYSILQKSLCEVSRIYYIWKNYKIKDYIGFCHYRRYFEQIPELNENITIVPKKFIFDVYSQYSACHIIDDYILMREIMHDLYNISYDKIKVAESYLYPCNMFIMNKNDFNNYCNFLFSILDKFISIRNFNNMEDIYNYVKQFNSSDINYQTRLLGFLSERITSLYIQLFLKNIKEVNIKNV